jgi:hypothetical protein
LFCCETRWPRMQEIERKRLREGGIAPWTGKRETERANQPRERGVLQTIVMTRYGTDEEDTKRERREMEKTRTDAMVELHHLWTILMTR